MSSRGYVYYYIPLALRLRLYMVYHDSFNCSRKTVLFTRCWVTVNGRHINFRSKWIIYETLLSVTCFPQLNKLRRRLVRGKSPLLLRNHLHRMQYRCLFRYNRHSRCIRTLRSREQLIRHFCSRGQSIRRFCSAGISR